MSSKPIYQWLQTQCALLQGALAGAVRPASGDPDHAVLVGHPRNAPIIPALEAAANLAIQHNKPVIKAVEGPDGQSSTSALTIAHPLLLDKGLPGVAAFLLKGGDTELAKQALHRLQQGIPWLEQLLRNDCGEADSTRERLGKLTRLIAATLAPERFSAAATALTTELAAELDCERVFLGMMRSRKTGLEAISRTAALAPREPFSQAVVAAMDEASDQAALIALPPPEDAPASGHITLKHEALKDRFDTGCLCTAPLICDDEVIGALLFEREAGQPFDSEELALFEQISRFLAPILKMKYRTGKPFPGRMADRLSRWKRWLLSRQGAAWKAAFGGALAALIALGTVPVAYEVTTPSRLEGSVQRSISAPASGFIKQVHVRPGDRVHKGDLLVELDDEDLQLEKEKAENEIHKLDSQYGQALAERDRAKLAVIQAGIAEATAKLELIEQQLARTQLRSPLDGIVLEGDLTQSLGAPVDQGDNLLTLTPSLDFRIVLDVDERDIDEIQPDLTGLIAFSADPSRHYPIRITHISPVAQIKNQRNVFEVEARFDDSPAQPLRPGFEGVARIHIDDRPPLRIAWQAFRDWVSLQLWRWLGLT